MKMALDKSRHQENAVAIQFFRTRGQVGSYRRNLSGPDRNIDSRISALQQDVPDY